jgi:hypothetical protein
MKTGSWVWERVEEQKKRGDAPKGTNNPRKQAGMSSADLEAMDYYEEQIKLARSSGNDVDIQGIYRKIRDNFGQQGIDEIKRRMK